MSFKIRIYIIDLIWLIDLIENRHMMYYFWSLNFFCLLYNIFKISSIVMLPRNMPLITFSNFVVKSSNQSKYLPAFPNVLRLFRSSRPEVFLGKGILKICSKFTGKHSCGSAISIKLLFTLRHGCSLVNLLDIFRTPFPKNTSGRLLLIVVTCLFLSAFICLLVIEPIQTFLVSYLFWLRGKICSHPCYIDIFCSVRGAFEDIIAADLSRLKFFQTEFSSWVFLVNLPFHVFISFSIFFIFYLFFSNIYFSGQMIMSFFEFFQANIRWVTVNYFWSTCLSGVFIIEQGIRFCLGFLQIL